MCMRFSFLPPRPFFHEVIEVEIVKWRHLPRDSTCLKFCIMQCKVSCIRQLSIQFKHSIYSSYIVHIQTTCSCLWILENCLNWKKYPRRFSTKRLHLKLPSISLQGWNECKTKSSFFPFPRVLAVFKIWQYGQVPNRIDDQCLVAETSDTFRIEHGSSLMFKSAYNFSALDFLTCNVPIISNSP